MASQLLRGNGIVFYGEKQIASVQYRILVENFRSLPRATGTIIASPEDSLMFHNEERLDGKILQLRLVDGRLANFIWTHHSVGTSLYRIQVSGAIE